MRFLSAEQTKDPGAQLRCGIEGLVWCVRPTSLMCLNPARSGTPRGLALGPTFAVVEKAVLPWGALPCAF